MLVKELVDNLEKASKDLSDLEAIKKSIQGDVDSLVKKRSELEASIALEQKGLDLKTKDLKESKSAFEKRIDEKNLVLSKREQVISSKEVDLSKKELSLAEREKLVLEKSNKVDTFMKEYKESVLGKSEQFKLLAEKIKG